MFLNCHSCFSMRYGTLNIEQLTALAKDRGADTLVLTDINNTSGWFDFLRSCKEQHIKPLLGIEYRNGIELLYIGIAKNKRGLLELNRLLSHSLHTKEPLPPKPPQLPNIFFIYPFRKDFPFAELREHEFVGIRPYEVKKIRLGIPEGYLNKLVMLHPVTFADKAGFNLHRLLRAIDQNCLLSKLPSEACAEPYEMMPDISELVKQYSPYPQLIRNTMELLNACNVDEAADTMPKNRRTFTGSESSDRELLEKLALEGCKERYGNNREAVQRIKKELRIIGELNFAAYFLITWDIIRYASSRGFRHVGRGSGANSIVAYCLKITEVDPIELDLYFERFINPFRTSPPDFDIDFSWNERDEVLDYIFKRYGPEHVSLLATYSTFKGKSIIRELGKVFGLPKSEIDALIRTPVDKRLDNQISRWIFKYGSMMRDFPNHLSIHAGGVLITEEPMQQYTATHIPPKGFITTQFDMFVAEDWGIFKYDILSQRGLGHIKDTVQMVKEQRGISIDIDDTAKFKKDEKINTLLRTGQCAGCFYIESPAMRQLLKKVDCHDYLTLVAASSIIRPGVAKSGMMKAYIERHFNPDSFEYLHPKMKELLSETHGVMVYQEDVIKVAHHFAGLDLGEADILRRAMSGKYRNKDGFKKIEDTFFKNCTERGYPDTIAKEVWRQMESFSGYSFSKAHSASFAVESYQSLFLKVYYPLEFITAVINNFGGFYSTSYYFNEAKRSGGKVNPPCANHSNYLTRLIGDTLYMGWVHIDSLESAIAHTIVTEREKRGMFTGLNNFCERVPVSFEQVVLLIKAGAFAFTQQSKKKLYWEANMLLQKTKVPVTANSEALFKTETRTWTLPQLDDSVIENMYDELELFGFVTGNIFDLLAEYPKNTVTSKELCNFKNKWQRMVGFYITTKDVKTVHSELMQFATFLDINGDTFDTIHFPPSLKKYPLTGRGFYLLEGKVIEEYGIYNLEVSKAIKLPMKADERYSN